MPFCHGKRNKTSLQAPYNGKKTCGRRVSPRALARGSLTLEAALALPVFLCAAAALICMFSFYSAYAREDRALMERAQTLAVTAGQALSSDPYIELSGNVSVELPFSGLFSGNGKMVCRASVRCWVGYTGESFTEQQGEEMVYVTPEGTVYHKSRDCSYLKLTVRTVSLASLAGERNLSGSKYTACESCAGGVELPGSVYVTDYGTSYHVSRSCSGLKRTVMAVPLSEAAGYRACSRCCCL